MLSAEGGFTARQGHQKEIDQVPLVARALGLNIEGYHQYQPSVAIFMEIMNWTLGFSAFSDKTMRRAGRATGISPDCKVDEASDGTSQFHVPGFPSASKPEPHMWCLVFLEGKNVGNLWKPHYPMGQNYSFLSTFPQRSSKQTIDLGE